MPVLVAPLQPDGAIVEVLIGWSASDVHKLRMALQPIPASVSASALLDTGAEITCLDVSLVQALGLPVGGVVLANVPALGGPAGTIYRDINLTVVHPSGNSHDNLIEPNLTTLEVNLGPLGYQMLIGRDVLARCRFLYHGPRGRFRLAY
jgi:hypothetical protein